MIRLELQAARRTTYCCDIRTIGGKTRGEADSVAVHVDPSKLLIFGEAAVLDQALAEDLQKGTNGLKL